VGVVAGAEGGAESTEARWGRRNAAPAISRWGQQGGRGEEGESRRTEARRHQRDDVIARIADRKRRDQEERETVEGGTPKTNPFP
jgi:hypothetical protein